MPFSRWGAKPYVIHPLIYPSGISLQLLSAAPGRNNDLPLRTHAFHRALQWRQQIANDPQLNQAKIASREQVSRARVTQVMQLLQLPSEIQIDLQSPPAPLEIHSFGERQLRGILDCGNRQTQLTRWRDLVDELRLAATQ